MTRQFWVAVFAAWIAVGIAVWGFTWQALLFVTSAAVGAVLVSRWWPSR